MQDSVLPAVQMNRVACLLGRAALRWQRNRIANPRSSEIVSDSLPERLESRPVSSLSVTGRNDRATGSIETGSRHETPSLCEEQRQQIATLIVEAIRRHAEKIANQRLAADADENKTTEVADEP